MARYRDPEVDHIQACNTLIHDSKGFHAYNTDYLGFLDSLRHHLPKAIEGHEAKTEGSLEPMTQFAGSGRMLQDRTVLILGAGGIARAVTYAVVSEGGLATIVNRTPERAQRLAEEFNCRHVDWNARHNVLADLVINCTSVGMHPDMDASPLHPSYLKPGLTVFDTVYTPEQTLLVKEARSRGCHVITGVDLFVRQAALQFHLFTGQPAPTALMQELIKRFLSPVALKPASPPPGPDQGE
jgi:3-dehydroquinate dehydratase/shikimate dehydrogenase